MQIFYSFAEFFLWRVDESENVAEHTMEREHMLTNSKCTCMQFELCLGKFNVASRNVIEWTLGLGKLSVNWKSNNKEIKC